MNREIIPFRGFSGLPSNYPDKEWGELNIIEGLWGWLKDTCVNNVFYAKFYQIKLAINKFITMVNSNPLEVINRLCVQL